MPIVKGSGGIYKPQNNGLDNKDSTTEQHGKNSQHAIKPIDTANKLTQSEDPGNSPHPTDLKKRRFAQRRDKLSESNDINVPVVRSKSDVKAEKSKLFHDISHIKSLQGAINLLDEASPDVIEVLSKEKKFPTYAQAALNRRALAQKLDNAIDNEITDLFRLNGKVDLVKQTLNNFDKKHLPSKLLDDPISCAHLFKEVLKEEPPIEFDTFRNIGFDTFRKSLDSRQEGTLKTALLATMDQLTDDKADNLKVSLAVIQKAYNQAPVKGSHNLAEKRVISKDAFADMLTQNLFDFPEEKDIDAALEQREYGKSILEYIVALDFQALDL